jgi:hypothetical protein
LVLGAQILTISSMRPDSDAYVHIATSQLAKAGRKTAKDEMHKALGDLSKRPHPDLTGAVHHAMAALECVASDVCGEKGETLGQIVKRHPNRFPPPIGRQSANCMGLLLTSGEYGVDDDSDLELLNRYRVFHEPFERLELCELETLLHSS